MHLYLFFLFLFLTFFQARTRIKIYWITIELLNPLWKWRHVSSIRGHNRAQSRFNLTVLTRNLETTITPFSHPRWKHNVISFIRRFAPKSLAGNYLIECNGLSGTRVEKLQHLAETSWWGIAEWFANFSDG